MPGYLAPIGTEMQSLIIGLVEMFDPLFSCLNDTDVFNNFFASLGWDFSLLPSFPTTLVTDAISDLLSNLSDFEDDFYERAPTSFQDILQFLLEIKAVFDNLNDIGTCVNISTAINDDVKSEFNTLSGELFDYLLATHLEQKVGFANSLLEILGVIVRTEVLDKYDTSGNLIRRSYQKRQFNFDNFKTLISNSFDYLIDFYYPNGNTTLNTITDATNFTNALFPALELLLAQLNFITYYGIDAAFQSDFTSDEFQSGQKALYAVTKDQNGNNYGFILNVSSVQEGDLGYIITPFGDFNINQTFGPWDVSLSIAAMPEAIVIKNKEISLSPEFTGDFQFVVNIANNSTAGDDNPLYNFSVSQSIAFYISNISAVFAIETYGSQPSDYKFEFSLAGGQLNIYPTDTDNFIGKLISDKGIAINFNFTLGYSKQKGFYISGGTGVDVHLPVHETFGGLNFTDILFSMSVNNGDIPIAVATSFNVDIGPLLVSVADLGIRANISFPSSGGNLGKLNVDTSFKPPTGLGIAINADPVTGGGFLNYDEATYTYTGALQLKFSEISLNAVGILTTKMPDGSNDYSLLILITADFTPIQLGMGFTLNGVGGLLGLNRTMNTDKLRTGVKDGSLNNILFPQNVIANANTIISNVSQAFPIQQDDFIIGPMAKIGWGTPTLLTIELGVMIQLPSPVVLAILGVIKAVLPTQNAPVLTIQVNFLGVIDFGKKYLSFDASLFDSKILTFALTGDMALRLYWGDNPNFLLSVGGFHPKYTPPPTMNLPTMQRLAITLSNDDNLQIKVQTYFAVTSNTAQFGASVNVIAKAWKIQAVGAVWFDVLFQFSPFYFTADMGAMFAIKMGSSTILSIHVDLTLEGPHPWHAQGNASFKVVLVRVHVSFNKTFGQAITETVVPVQIYPQLQAALVSTENWQVTGPDRSHQVVTFRSITVPTGQLVVDPFGTLQVSQKVVPLNTTISKFGTSAISDDNSFSIGQITSGGTVLPSYTVQDYFSPNSFFYLTDDQKLSRASYELYNSGISIGDPDGLIADYFVHKELQYENIVLDIRRRLVIDRAILSDTEMQMHVNTNYVTASSLSSTKNQVPPQGPSKVKVNTATSFVVADKNTMGTVSGFFTNMTDAQNHLDDLLSANGSATNYMIVNAFELI